LSPPGLPRWIDLNADVGESREALADGREEGILRVVSSANVACGGHAGDQETMAGVIAIASRLGVSVGAHPGYPDRAGFGRDSMGMAADAIEAVVFEQLRALGAVAGRLGCEVVHVKPHGALYNDAARDRAVAAAIARGARRWNRDVVLVGLAGSAALDVFVSEGFRAVAECFADRAYEADGSLRSRRLPGALIAEPEKAAEQAVSIARRGYAIAHGGEKVPVAADTMCIHGDSPGAIAIATAVRAALESCGVAIRPLARNL
jgi:UPF0271 protein